MGNTFYSLGNNSFTSLQFNDLRHNPQNLSGFVSESVAVNLQPRCLWHLEHAAMVHPYLKSNLIEAI